MSNSITELHKHINDIKIKLNVSLETAFHLMLLQNMQELNNTLMNLDVQTYTREKEW